MATAGGAGGYESSDDEIDPVEALARAQAVASSRDAAKKILAGQYKSNIAFGSEEWTPVAGHASEFRAYDLAAAASDNARSAAQRKDQTSAHYEFGADTLDYATTAGRDFAARGGGPSALSEKQKEEVRSVHFVLGNVPVDYTSEAKKHFSGGQLDPTAGSAHADAAEFKRDLRATHYKFGADEATWETTGGDFADVSSKISLEEREKTREGIRVQTTLLRASNIAFSSRRDFYGGMRERMPDPRDSADSYKKDTQAEETMKNARFDSVCLGEDEDDWRTCTMDLMGDKKKRINRRYKPPAAAGRK
mmetsp:Transcript_69456/g.168074  ORF Transcript_69456/g.168074 Transcript_69456/m.168074 type:complete len:306 (+) Transcript_69456:204-1121(+)